MTKLTVAALQLAFTDDTVANIAPSPSSSRSRGQGRARSCCRPSCSKAPTSAGSRMRAVRERPADGRHPVGRGDAGARGGAEDLDPDQLLRGGRAALLQHARDDRPRRQDRRASTARATSPTAPATRRNSTSAPATPASRSGDGRARDARRRRLLGPMVSRNARAMMLMGAEILFYPTAIGTEPHDPDLDTRGCGGAR